MPLVSSAVRAPVASPAPQGRRTSVRVDVSIKSPIMTTAAPAARNAQVEPPASQGNASVHRAKPCVLESVWI